MTVARLDASLLARKGTALPIANAYANPFLDPAPPRRERPGRNRAAVPRCRLRPDLHAQLRIPSSNFFCSRRERDLPKWLFNRAHEGRAELNLPVPV